MEEYCRNLVVFPERFPAVRMIFVDNETIYVLTNAQIGETREIWILDLQGELLGKKMVPLRMHTPLRRYPFTAHGGRVYQLLPDDSTGLWDLYRADIQ